MGDTGTMDTYTRPDWGRSALLTIDVQRDFTLAGAVFCIPGTMEAIPAMRRVLEAYRAADLPIIHIVRLYLPDGSNVDLCRRALVEGGTAMAVPGSDGSQLVVELLPSPELKLDPEQLLAGEVQQIGPKEWILYKPRFGAFYQTRLESHLRDRGTTTVVVAGCNYPNCPRTTIYEATERDFRVVMVSDAVSGTYERGIQELINIGVNVTSSADVEKALALVRP